MLGIALSAIIPPTALLAFVCLASPRRKKPLAAIAFTFFLGAALIVVAVPVERLAFSVLGTDYQHGIALTLAKNTLLIALVEELVKAVAVVPALRSKDFKYVYDGIVFCVAASLGFAAVENFGYLTTFGSSLLVERSLFPIASHALFGVMMGCGLGAMRYWQILGNAKVAHVHAVVAIALPVLAHGLYDSALELGIASEPLVLALFVAITAVAVVPFAIRKKPRWNEQV